jgi:hypothetical protein
MSLLVLWLRPAEKKLGILKFHPLIPGKVAPKAEDFEDSERKAIAAYIQRNNL